MAAHPVTNLLEDVRSRLSEGAATTAETASTAPPSELAEEDAVSGDLTEDPTPKRIHGGKKKGPGRGRPGQGRERWPARWNIPLTQREEQMLQRLVDHFDYPRAILGRMLLRDAYRELFSDKPAEVGALEE